MTHERPLELPASPTHPTPCTSSSVVRTTMADGATLDVVEQRSCELRDARGRLLVRYSSDGLLEITSPGDLVLSAPEGAVRIAAQRGISLEAPKLHATIDAVELRARSIETFADEATHSVERLEIRATRLIQRSREVIRDVTGLVQERAGRMRLLVGDLLSIQSRSTAMLSERETSIDGSRVHLG